MSLAAIGNTLLAQNSSRAQLQAALDDFTRMCAEVTGIEPAPGFDGWNEDAHLASGVAIHPRAAAHCAKDYLRSVMFIRGVYAAIRVAQARFTGEPVKILYAGCGPFATLLLPLLDLFRPGELEVHLLDIHQRSLDSAGRLIAHFGFTDHKITTLHADACSYQHPRPLHIVIAETMQKALEQEPQLALTANLAPQLHPQGLFLPQEVEVELSLAQLQFESSAYASGAEIDPSALELAGKRHRLGTLMRLSQTTAVAILHGKQLPAVFNIPRLIGLSSFDLVLFTRVIVFGGYQLMDYESEITLPLKCHDVGSLTGGDTVAVSYHLGSYPKFCVTTQGAGPQ